MATSTQTVPESCRAILQLDPQQQSLSLANLPVPRVKAPNEHLIRVHAVALCKGELLWHKNFPPSEPEKDRKRVPGYDIAGTVVIAGASSPFKTGDEIYCRTNFRRTGALRDYTIALTEELALRPRRLSWTQSAAVALSAETAWQALFVHARLESLDSGLAKGKRVLVTAASGGVGTWLIQLARLAGADVIGTCGPSNIDFVRSLGASEVLDYRTTDLSTWGSHQQNQVDIVVDCIGGRSLEGAWWAVKDGGVLISINQPPDQVRPESLKSRNVKSLFFIMDSVGKQLEQITRLIDEGKCEPTIDSVYSFNEYSDAFERLESGHAKGKVVIDLDLETTAVS
ncbi:MAG: hypothetical protein LQ351_006556 [Letrouitia transgressa]|nr:MAG: hypothetical protein LQ351_006556 [Letrouitia transgressa]